MENTSLSINERVKNIKNNKDEINRFIQEYKPFIASTVQGSIGRFVRYGEDDEISIGLIAFEEAIRTYDITKGNFLSFAKNVIKRRLIDYYRKESKHNKVIPLINERDSEDDEDIDFSTQEAVKQYSEKELAELRRAEINELSKELSKWDITFFDVAKNSPKQEGTRKIYMQIVSCIVNSSEIIKKMKEKLYLPIADIEKISKVPRKKIERARNYIIAVVLIKIGDYQYLESFIDWR